MVLLEKLIVTQLVKKFPDFYGTRKSITVFTRISTICVLSQMNSVHTFLPYFTEIHSNIILPYTVRWSQWSLSFTFPDQNFVCSSLFHACYMP